MITESGGATITKIISESFKEMEIVSTVLLVMLSGLSSGKSGKSLPNMQEKFGIRSLNTTQAKKALLNFAKRPRGKVLGGGKADCCLSRHIRMQVLCA